MNCAYSSKKGNCIGCDLTRFCLIYKEWRRLTEIGFKENRIDELIDLVKHVLGMFNIVSNADLKNKKNQEQFRDEIMELQDKLSELKQE
jgi:hypothetical protein